MSEKQKNSAASISQSADLPDLQTGILYDHVKAAPEHQKKELILNFLIDDLSKILAPTNSTEQGFTARRDMGLRDQGLNSLKAVVFMNRLKKAVGEDLGKKLSITALFTYPTARGVAEYLARDIFKLENLSSANEKINPVSRNNVGNEPIAIIGLGCKFPGAISNPTQLWELLQSGKHAITEIPSSRWSIEEYFDADRDVANKMYIRDGGFINSVDEFDADFFSISPREAMALDPQHRLLLETTWEALENACVAPDSLSKSKGSVFVGISTKEYSELLESAQNREELEQHIPTGNNLNAAAGRISYFLGLQGPCMSIDTACSSSLVALSLACQALRSGDSELSIAAGVNLMITPRFSIQLCKTNALSVDGKCKTFDSEANGYVRSEGCGVLILKSLSKALADGDNIQSLILSVAVNQDGRSSSLTAPNGEAQEKLLELALAKAGVEAAEVSYVEAHGTGTPLGDPVEMEAIGNVYGKGRPKNFPLFVGSIKTNIGHVESAAGIAGVIKATLCLQNRQIPAHLNFRKLNPDIDIDRIPAIIPMELTDWQTSSKSRLAGVSSFGFSGTNAHVILKESSPSPDVIKNGAAERPVHIFCLSARTRAALRDSALAYVLFLENSKNLSVADICYTAANCRAQFDERLAITCKDVDELKAKLSTAIESNFESGCALSTAKKDEKLAFLFSGQGSQYLKMCKQLYDTEPTFKSNMDKCAEILSKHLPTPILKVIFENKELLNETQYTQPALFIIEYCLYQLWNSWGVKADVVMGHSLGELVAACICNVFSLEDGIKLIVKRSALMQKLDGETLMAAVNLSELDIKVLIEKYGDRISIAASNTPTGTTISGYKNEVASVLKTLEAQKIKVKILPVSHAFHSSQMDPILDEFEKFCSEIKFSKPRLLLVSNLNGKLAEVEVTDPKYWREHIRRTVRFNDGVVSIREQGIRNFLEVGPGTSSIGMAGLCLAEEDARYFFSVKSELGDWESLAENIASLYVNGFKFDWKAFEVNTPPRRKVILPTYSFQRQRFWIETNKKQRSDYNFKGHPLLGNQVQIAGSSEVVYQSEVGTDDPAPFLADHIVFGTEVLPATAYIDLIFSAVRKTAGDFPVKIEGMAIEQPLLLFAEVPKRIQVKLLLEETKNTWRFQIFSQNLHNSSNVPAAWALHSHGRVSLYDAPIEVTSDESIADIQLRCKKSHKIEEFYKNLFDGGLEFGAKFHGVKSLETGNGEAIGKVELVSGLEGEVDKYSFHPALLDCCQQVFTSIYSVDQVEAKHPRIFLPISYEKIILYRKPPNKIWSHVTYHNGKGDKTIRGGFRIVDSNNFPILECFGLTMIEAPREALIKMVQKQEVEIGEWLYEIAWRQSPTHSGQRDHLLQKVKNAQWLIVSDNGKIGSKVSEKLKNYDAEVFELRPSESVKNDSNFRADIDKSLRKLINSKSGVKKLNLVFLCGLDHGLEFLDKQKEPNFDLNSLEYNQQFIYGYALSVVQALIESKEFSEIKCSFITRGAQSVGNNPELVALSQSTLWGLGKVISLEQPKLHVLMLDLDPQAADKEFSNEAEIIIAETIESESELQIAFRKNERKVARLTKQAKNKTVERVLATVVRSDSTYVVTGGLGGIGLQLAKWLVDRGARNIVLLGRRSPDEKAKLYLAQLSKSGANIKTESVDVSNELDMKMVFDKIEKEMPPLKGIIHAAGSIKDAFLSMQDWQTFQTVMKPKILGAWNLHKLTYEKDLDFFCCFSSATSLLGNVGQANYAAANAFLDSLSFYRKARGKVSTTINWGPWAGIGMVDSVGIAQAQLGELGYDTIPIELGLRALEAILETQPSQTGVL